MEYYVRMADRLYERERSMAKNRLAIAGYIILIPTFWLLIYYLASLIPKPYLSAMLTGYLLNLARLYALDLLEKDGWIDRLYCAYIVGLCVWASYLWAKVALS